MQIDFCKINVYAPVQDHSPWILDMGLPEKKVLPAKKSAGQGERLICGSEHLRLLCLTCGSERRSLAPQIFCSHHVLLGVGWGGVEGL